MSPEEQAELLVRARGLSRKRDYPGAIAVYRQLIEHDPDSVSGHEGLAMVGFVGGDYETAIAAFVRLVQLQPTEPRHYVNLGAVYNRIGEHQKAAEVLRKAIQRDRKCADAYYNLGIAQKKLNQGSMAISAYKEAIRLNPDMAEAYQNLGNVYAEMNNHTLAITNFKKALEIRPDFEKARVALERAEDAVHQAKANRNPFGRLVAAAPPTPDTPRVTQRELSDEERAIDRQRVQLMAHELSDLTHACHDYLQKRFEPALLELQRVVAEGDTAGFHYGRSVEQFAEALEQWSQMSARWREKIEEMRQHEARIAQPDGTLG
jgi:tetratricopeptide (TPR) repeat protein